MKCTNVTWRCVARTLLLLIVAVLCGCNRDRGPERVVVSGTVTYNGKSVPRGMIRFVSVQANPGPTAGAIITDGSYRADGHGGVSVGTHTIQIEAYRKPSTPPPPNMPRMPGEPQEQYLPKKFNVDTNLEISIPSGSPAISKNFDLAD